MKKNLMALILSILLCLVVLPAAALADEMITEVCFGFDVPLAGSAAGHPTITIPAEYAEKYTVTFDQWRDASGFNLDSSAIFDPEDEYHGFFTVTSKAGYKLTSETSFTLSSDSSLSLKPLGYLERYHYETFDIQFYPVIKETIRSIDLTGVPSAAPGHQADSYTFSCAQYTVSNNWQVYDYATGSWKDFAIGSAFASENLYRQQLLVHTKPGYCFDPYSALSVFTDAGEHFANSTERTYSAAQQDLYFALGLKSSGHLYLDEDIIPKAVIGQSFADQLISIPVPDDADCTVTGRWVYEENGIPHYSGVFEKGKAYVLLLEVRPKESFVIDELISLFIGDQFYLPDQFSYERNVFSLRSSFCDQITSAELVNPPVLSVGDVLQAGEFPLQVPAGARYCATARWVYDDAEDGVSGIVKDGMRYALEVILHPDEGYEFAQYIDLTAYGTRQKRNTDITSAYYEHTFSFRKTISSVSLRYPPLQIGKPVPSAGDVTLPAGAPYDVQALNVLDMNSLTPAAAFEKGRDYMLDIIVSAKPGCEFADTAAVWLNGEETYNCDLLLSNEEIVLAVPFSTKEVIPLVEIGSMQEMQVGQQARSDVQVPADARYSVAYAQWHEWNETARLFTPFTDVFQYGKAYQLFVDVLPDDGYAFETGVTRLLVNGAESRWRQLPHGLEYTLSASTGLPIIDTLFIEVDEPVAGTHSSYAPTVRFVNGSAAHAEVDIAEWLLGKPESYRHYYEHFFRKDGKYGVSLWLQPKGSYVFSDDMTIVINGIRIPASLHEVNDAKNHVATYFFGMPGVPYQTQQTQQSLPPATGDDFRTEWWLGLMLASMASMAVVLIRRKRMN